MFCKLILNALLVVLVTGVALADNPQLGSGKAPTLGQGASKANTAAGKTIAAESPTNTAAIPTVTAEVPHHPDSVRVPASDWFLKVMWTLDPRNPNNELSDRDPDNWETADNIFEQLYDNGVDASVGRRTLEWLKKHGCPPWLLEFIVQKIHERDAAARRAAAHWPTNHHHHGSNLKHQKDKIHIPIVGD